MNKLTFSLFAVLSLAGWALSTVIVTHLMGLSSGVSAILGSVLGVLVGLLVFGKVCFARKTSNKAPE
ncbi:MAG: hypothetical protein KDD64_06385 [Bdellovibrionales bacterium]|nr:hypothetical protein [Bdellovibrionales bacterium]